MSDKTNGHMALTDKIDFRKIRKQKMATVYIEQLQRELTLVPVPTHVLVDLRDDPYSVEKQLAWSIVDPGTMNPIFDPTNTDDIANLAELTLDITRQLMPVFNRLNGLSTEAIEATEKNSQASPISGSATA
jgi:hypothetical protein